MGSLQNRNQRSSLLFSATPDLRSLFLSTAAASGLLLAVSALDPAVFPLATKAQAATTISANINFYEDLAAYGNWVSYQDRYVWIPDKVDDHWRPYTKGHWAHTRRYGWVWVSDERFGWATYHYGRWGYSHEIGWYWVPGRRWAPAWVAWSYDGDDIAWAPLPPHHYDGYEGANIVVSFGFIPDIYWQAVPVSKFLSADLSGHMYRDRDRVHRVIKRGVSRTVRILDKTVLNNVIKVDDIEKKTKKKVVVLEENVVDNPDAVDKVDSDSVAIFNPEVREEPDAKPKRIKKVEEIVMAREAKGIPDKEESSGQVVTTTDESVTKPKKDATGAELPQKSTASTGQPALEKTVVPANELTVAIDTPRVAELKPDELSIQAPAAQKPALPPSKTLNLDTVDYDKTGNIVFGGRGPAGSKVLLYIDNNSHGLAFINDKGTWSFAGLSSLTVGPHTLRANEIGDDGAVKSRIEMPFYREDPARVAKAPLIPATPDAPKPTEAATAQDVPAPTPPDENKKKKDAAAPERPNIEKSAQVTADEQTVVPENKEKEVTASIDQPDIEKTVEMPVVEQAAPIEMKKKETTASIDPPDIEKTVEAPVVEPIVPVEEKKKKEATASTDQPKIEKTVEIPVVEQAAPIEMKKKETTASIDPPDIEKIVEAPVVEPIVPVEVMKKKEATASTDQPKIEKTVEAPAGKQAAPVEIKKKKAAVAPDQKAVKTSALEPAREQAVPVEEKKKRKLSKQKHQSTKRVILETNLPDAGAESWRIHCSPRIGGGSKASETFISSTGKRVSCALRPKNWRAAAAEAVFMKYGSRSD